MSTNLTRRQKRLSIVVEAGVCAYCGRDLAYKNWTRATVDHVVPKSQGGGNRRDNLRACCVSCNQAKRDRTPAEWIREIAAAVGLQIIIKENGEWRA